MDEIQKYNPPTIIKMARAMGRIVGFTVKTGVAVAPAVKRQAVKGWGYTKAISVFTWFWTKIISSQAISAYKEARK